MSSTEPQTLVGGDPGADSAGDSGMEDDVVEARGRHPSYDRSGSQEPQLLPERASQDSDDVDDLDELAEEDEWDLTVQQALAVQASMEFETSATGSRVLKKVKRASSTKGANGNVQPRPRPTGRKARRTRKPSANADTAADEEDADDDSMGNGSRRANIPSCLMSTLDVNEDILTVFAPRVVHVYDPKTGRSNLSAEDRFRLLFETYVNCLIFTSLTRDHKSIDWGVFTIPSTSSLVLAGKDVLEMRRRNDLVITNFFRANKDAGFLNAVEILDSFMQPARLSISRENFAAGPQTEDFLAANDANLVCAFSDRALTAETGLVRFLCEPAVHPSPRARTAAAGRRKPHAFTLCVTPGFAPIVRAFYALVCLDELICNAMEAYTAEHFPIGGTSGGGENDEVRKISNIIRNANIINRILRDDEWHLRLFREYVGYRSIIETCSRSLLDIVRTPVT